MEIENALESKSEGPSQKHQDRDASRPMSGAENPNLSGQQAQKEGGQSSLPLTPKAEKGNATEVGHPGPIGLDVGTANIVMAQNRNEGTETHLQLNAFFPIPYTSITKQTLVGDN
ncbi:MAG: hypothetical protein GY849_07190, partial [Deltaproteobacteria bacterium]|nr:hypothetical protein [Deltaproteobacteria bacterium]